MRILRSKIGLEGLPEMILKKYLHEFLDLCGLEIRSAHLFPHPSDLRIPSVQKEDLMSLYLLYLLADIPHQVDYRIPVISLKEFPDENQLPLLLHSLYQLDQLATSTTFLKEFLDADLLHPFANLPYRPGQLATSLPFLKEFLPLEGNR
ncbi:hypothetical protein TorRG33x02_098440 [Trema orientale]|uniref:Uncharacterized protein n=1 Tax=Trema orientale TaxID=63057 RepID=A0A2P5F995_TREOI|nr:hypothetical protein TorRG33x02_098440 [Trema orientale]